MDRVKFVLFLMSKVIYSGEHLLQVCPSIVLLPFELNSVTLLLVSYLRLTQSEGGEGGLAAPPGVNVSSSSRPLPLFSQLISAEVLLS